jgi:hypothetical protein
VPAEDARDAVVAGHVDSTIMGERYVGQQRQAGLGIGVVEAQRLLLAAKRAQTMARTLIASHRS